MLYTYTFNNTRSRDEFINIVKELWFSVDINTYTEIKSSKSEVKEHILWDWRDVKTINQTVTVYEVSIEKDLNQEETNKFNDFLYYYFSKEKPKPDARIFDWIWGWFWLTLIIRWLLALIFKFIKIPYLIDIYNVDLYKYLLLWWLFLVFTLKFQKSSKPEAIEKAKKVEEKNKRVKEMLIKEYLWEYGKKIINNR